MILIYVYIIFESIPFVNSFLGAAQSPHTAIKWLVDVLFTSFGIFVQLL